MLRSVPIHPQDGGFCPPGWHRASHGVKHSIQHAFEAWGDFIAVGQRPWCIIVSCIIVVLLGTAGVLNQEVATSSQYLFSPRISRAKDDRRVVRVLFPYNSTRAESWIIKSTGLLSPNGVAMPHRGDDGAACDSGDADAPGYSSGLWSAEGIALAMAIHDDVLNTKSPAAGGIPVTRMQDVCQQGTAGNCSASGAPLCAFNSSSVQLARQNLDAILKGGTIPGRAFATPATPVTFPVCLQEDPNHALAYLPMSAGRAEVQGDALMVGASALRMDYQVTLDDWTDPISGSGDGPSGYVRSAASLQVQQWELSFIDTMERWAEKLRRSSLPALPLEQGGEPGANAPRVGLELVYLAGRSLDDGIEASSSTDIPLVVSTAALMCLFATLASGSIDTLVSRQTLVQAGVISAGLAVPLAFGLSALAGVKFVLLNASLPFLAIGLGIDDAFVLQAALSRMPRHWGLRRRMASTMREAGVAITVTSITDCLAFAVGGLLTQQRGVQNFCLYAMATVACDYALQITFFSAWMVLDARREAQGRSAVCCGRVAHPVGAGLGPEDDDDAAICPACALSCVQDDDGHPRGWFAGLPCCDPAIRRDGSVVGATARFDCGRDLRLPCRLSLCAPAADVDDDTVGATKRYAMLQEGDNVDGLLRTNGADANAAVAAVPLAGSINGGDDGPMLVAEDDVGDNEGLLDGGGPGVASAAVVLSSEFPGRPFVPEDRLLCACFRGTPFVALESAAAEAVHAKQEERDALSGKGGAGRHDVPVLSGACDRACASSFAPFLMRAEVRIAVLVLWVVYLAVFGSAIRNLGENLELQQLAPDDSYVHDFFQAQEEEFGGLQLPLDLSADGTDPSRVLGMQGGAGGRLFSAETWNRNALASKLAPIPPIPGSSYIADKYASLRGRSRQATATSMEVGFTVGAGFGSNGWASPSCYRYQTCRDGLASLAQLLGTSLDGNGVGQSWVLWIDGLRLLSGYPEDMTQPQFMQVLAGLLTTDVIGPMLRSSFALARGSAACSGAIDPASLHADGTPAPDGSKLYVPGAQGMEEFLQDAEAVQERLRLNQTVDPQIAPCVVSTKVEVRTTPLYSSMDMGQAMVNLRATLDDGVGDHRAPAGQRAVAPARLWFEPFLFFEQFNSVRYSTIQTLLVCAAAMIAVAIVLLPSLPIVLLVGVMLISIDIGVLGGMSMWGGEGIDLNSVTAINLCLGLGISLDMVSHPAEGFFQAWGNEWAGPFMLKKDTSAEGTAHTPIQQRENPANYEQGASRVADETNGVAVEGQAGLGGKDSLEDSQSVRARNGRPTDAANQELSGVGATSDKAKPSYFVGEAGEAEAHWNASGVGKPLPCMNAGNGDLLGLGGAVERALHVPESWVWGGAEPRARVIVSMVSLGRPVLYGGLSSLLGVALLSGSTSYIFRCFFVCLFLVLSVGLFHALLVIPVLLSFVGGKRQRQ